jgi:hypothetical protein
VRKRIADVGQEIVPRAQRTPRALASHQKGEIEKWTSMSRQRTSRPSSPPRNYHHGALRRTRILERQGTGSTSRPPAHTKRWAHVWRYIAPRATPTESPSHAGRTAAPGRGQTKNSSRGLNRRLNPRARCRIWPPPFTGTCLQPGRRATCHQAPCNPASCATAAPSRGRLRASCRASGSHCQHDRPSCSTTCHRHLRSLR